MFCTNCGKSIELDTKFCPHCGARQVAESQRPSSSPVPPPGVPPIYASAAGSPSMAAPASVPPVPVRGGNAAVWAVVVALVVAIAGGFGYWGWSNKVAGDEAVQKLASEDAARKVAAEDAARKFADEAQRRIAAEKTAEAAEFTAAQALLDKHIADEEFQAQGNVQAGTSARGTTVRR
jgi:hypothetical protein